MAKAFDPGGIPRLGGMGIVAAGASDVEADVPLASWRLVTGGYFRTLGLPLASGRTFDERDRRSSPEWRFSSPWWGSTASRPIRSHGVRPRSASAWPWARGRNNGTEPTQDIASADYFADDPPWVAGAVAQAMSPSDGAFDQQFEAVEATVSTTGLARGRHTLFVRGTDADLNDGALSAVFLHVIDPGIDPFVQGLVHDAVTLAPLAATVTIGEFVTTTDPGTGLYSLQVPSGTYDITAASVGYQSQTATGVVASDFQSVQQDFDLLVETVCGDGSCDAGEDCNGCPADCPSFPIGASCGNGLCEAGDGEDCVSCPQDCNGVQNGQPSQRFCCGFGGDMPVGCGSSACTTGGFACTETPVGGSGNTCCGDLACEGPEDGFNCSLDCGPPPVCGDGTCDPGEDTCSCAADCGAPPSSEAGLCTDGADNDCDLAVDCADPDCDGIDPACQAVDCSTFGDKTSCNAEPSCRWDNRNKVCVAS